MKQNRKYFGLTTLVFLVLSGFIILSSCEISPDGENPGEEGTDPIPAPENLLGTIALDNGKSGVMDIQFSSDSSNLVPGNGPRATVGVSGKVRYEGEDFTVEGTYDDATGTLDISADNSGGNTLVFSGGFDLDAGFSGTVTLYATDGSTILAEGVASAADATNAERAGIRFFTGTFGGDVWGTWNGTLTADRFYGTWAAFGIDDIRGTFSMPFSNNTVSFSSSGSVGLESAGGTLSGNTFSGNWQYLADIDEYEVYSGTWTGAEVDNNYDHHVPESGDSSSYLANLIIQSFENAVVGYDDYIFGGESPPINDNGDGTGYQIGPTFNNITLTIHLVFDDPYWNESYYVYDLNSYVDDQTGLQLDGELYFKYTQIDTESEEVVKEIYLIDSDVSNGTDDGGLIITYQDLSTSELFIDAEVDYENEVIGENNFASAYWELDGTSVLDSVSAVFF